MHVTQTTIPFLIIITFIAPGVLLSLAKASGDSEIFS